MLQSSLFIAILILVNLNYFIECGEKRQTACLKELNAFSVQKPTGNTSSDTRPRICSSNSSCCNKTIEEEMKTHITKKLMNFIHGRNERARRQFKDVYDELEDLFKNVLEQVSDSAVDSLQPLANGQLAQQAKPHIRTLADELRSSVTKKDLHVKNSTTAFFGNFYPLIYHYMVAKRKLPQEFAECLKDNVHVIMPFNDVPQRLTDFLNRKLQPLQQFLRGLQNIGRVLDVVDNVDLSNVCRSALVKMSYCSLCDGHSDVKPCAEYCDNTISSCLEPYNHIEVQWSSFITKLVKFNRPLAKSLDAFSMFERFQELVSESISHASHSKVATKVSQYCRNISDYTGNTITSLRKKQTDSTRDLGNGDLYLTTDVQNSYQHLPTVNDMIKQLTFVKSNLSDIQPYFKTFYKNICWKDGLSASQTEDKCWKGTQMGRDIHSSGIFKYDVDLSPINNKTIVDDVLLLLRQATKDIQRPKRPQVVVSGSGFGSASGEGSGGSGENVDIITQSGTDCNDDDDEDCDESSGGNVDDNTSADQPMKTVISKGPTKPTLKVAADSKASISYHTQTLVLGLLMLHIIFSR